MLNLCLTILIVYCVILNVSAGTCPYFEYERRRNEWIGVLTIGTATRFETTWAVQGESDNVEYLLPKSLTGSLRSPVEVTLRFTNQEQLPTLLKLYLNTTLVCTGDEPDSYEGVVSFAHDIADNTAISSYTPFDETSHTRQNRLPPPPNTAVKMTTSVPNISTTEQAINEVCGRRTSTFTPFIVGGQQVTLGQIPWLVAIMAKVRGGVFFVCGGSLISARTVISAAHCFQSNINKDNVVLYLGKHQLDNYNERFETREPSNIIINADYSTTIPPDADLAIIQFEQPVGFTDKISPICLWTGPEDVHEIAGQRGVVAGWGSDGLRNNVTNIPKMVDTSIVSDNVCRTDTHIPPQFVTSRVLCAGNLDDTGPCSGDSGSGLMVYINGRWQLRAIVSGGPKIEGECNLRSYVLYCDLAKHKTWLMSNILY